MVHQPETYKLISEAPFSFPQQLSPWKDWNVTKNPKIQSTKQGREKKTQRDFYFYFSSTTSFSHQNQVYLLCELSGLWLVQMSSERTRGGMLLHCVRMLSLKKRWEVHIYHGLCMCVYVDPAKMVLVVSQKTLPNWSNPEQSPHEQCLW